MELLNKPAIYLLYFKEDDSKVYIGKSIHIKDRFKNHISELNRGKHHNYKLQNLYNKYNNIEILILEYVDDLYSLSLKETNWINEFNSFDNGYNLTTGGDGSDFGENSPSALYDKDTYVTILLMLTDSTNTYYSISKELNVNISIISSIACRQSHAYLELEYPKEYSIIDRLKFTRNRQYTEDIYYNIMYQLANTNKKHNIISKELNISESIIEDISRGSTHKYLKDKYPEEYTKMILKKGTRRSGSQTGEAYPSVKSPKNIVFNNIYNATSFAKEHNLHPGHFGDLLRGKCKSHKGWILA